MRPSDFIQVPGLIPATPWKAEVSADLDGATLESDPASIEFPFPVLIVGAHCATVPIATVGGLYVPTTEDLLAFVDVDNKAVFTSRNERDTSAAGRDAYVTLASLDSRNCFWEMALDVSSPKLRTRFRWKRDPAGTAFAADQHVSITFYYRPLSETER